MNEVAKERSLRMYLLLVKSGIVKIKQIPEPYREEVKQRLSEAQ